MSVQPDDGEVRETSADGPEDEPEDGYESVLLEDRPEDDDLVDGEDEDPDDTPTYRRFDCTGETVDAAAVDAARRAVEAGDCIVLPTDTVYGIGADAFSADAVQGLLDAKNRGRDMPPPVLIGDASLIRALATDVPDQARELVERFWPGPLTIVCRIQPSLRMDLGDTDGTIALRVPDHALAREVLRRTGPLAVSSANISGGPAALTCDEAVAQLGNRVAVYLDGGALGTTTDADGTVSAAPQGLPSTIVDFTRLDDGQVLRRGALRIGELRAVVPGLLDLETPTPKDRAGDTAEHTDDLSAEPVSDDAHPVSDDADPEPGSSADPVGDPVTEPVHRDDPGDPR